MIRVSHTAKFRLPQGFEIRLIDSVEISAKFQQTTYPCYACNTSANVDREWVDGLKTIVYRVVHKL